MSGDETHGAAATADSAAHRMVALLLLACICNFVDRQIIGILALPIKRELGLSDTQLGVMGGLAFALLYSGLGIPIARLADRRNRVIIVSLSLAAWSVFTGLCGAAQNFWQLFFARMGVGIGEAGGLAPCYSLIADSYPQRQRGRALAVLSLGIPIGSSIGILLGGWMATAIGWRAAFLIVSLPGLVLAPLLLFGIREPARGRFDEAPPADAGAPTLADVLRTLIGKPSFWLLSLGSGAASIGGYGLMFWLPVLFSRSLKLSLVDLSMFYGSIVLVGGIVGLWVGGALVDRLGQRGPRAYARIPAIFASLTAPVYFIAMFAPSLAIAWPFFVLAQVMALSWYTPILAAMQQIAPATMRATVSAVYLFVNNLIGIGAGTVFFGFLSDRLTASYGSEALRIAILIGLGFYVVSGLLFALAARRIARDWSGPVGAPDRPPGPGYQRSAA